MMSHCLFAMLLFHLAGMNVLATNNGGMKKKRRFFPSLCWRSEKKAYLCTEHVFEP